MKNFFSIVVLACAFAFSARAVDVSIDTSQIRFSTNAKYTHGTAGATIAQGDLVFLDATDNKWKLADAVSVGGLATAKVAGMATTSAVSGQRVYVCTEDPNLTLNSGAIAAGTIYILSSTAGKIAPSVDGTTSGYIGGAINVVGVGLSATQLSFKIVRSDVVRL